MSLNIYKIQPLNKIYHPYRFQGKDIVTIREAAWLTDGTYKYEEVVRYVQLNDVLALGGTVCLKPLACLACRTGGLAGPAQYTKACAKRENN